MSSTLFKQILKVIGVATLLWGFQVIAQDTQKQDLDSLEKKVAYLIGYSVAQQITSSGLELDELALRAALEDVINKSPLKMSEEERSIALRMFEIKLQEAKAVEQKNIEIEKGQQFLAQNAQQDGVNVLDSGVQYRVLKDGKGASEKAGQKVKIRYVVRLLDGNEVEREAEPVEAELDVLVPGLAEAVRLMDEGAEWEVFIPQELAYPNGTMSIPAGSVIAYTVELVEIIN